MKTLEYEPTAEQKEHATQTPELGTVYPTKPLDPTSPDAPEIERGYDRTSQKEVAIPRPEIIDLNFLSAEDRELFEGVRQRARASETAHYNELKASVAAMGGQAVMSSALAGDISTHELIAVNYAKRVGVLGSSLSLDHQEELTKAATEALSVVPKKVEVDKALKADAQNAQELVRAKNEELRRKDQELEAVRDYLRVERDGLLPEWAMMSDDDPEKAFLDAKIKRLGILINPSLDTSFTQRIPTTGELEDRLQHVTPEDVSPARGIKIPAFAEKVLSIVGLHSAS